MNEDCIFLSINHRGDYCTNTFKKRKMSIVFQSKLLYMKSRYGNTVVACIISMAAGVVGHHEWEESIFVRLSVVKELHLGCISEKMLLL